LSWRSTSGFNSCSGVSLPIKTLVEFSHILMGERMTDLTRTIASYSLAFGEEEGVSFCAILWPEVEGEMPFKQAPNMRLHLDGFALFDSDLKTVIGFFGVDAASKEKLLSHHVVIFIPSPDGYSQLEVISHDLSPRITLS